MHFFVGSGWGDKHLLDTNNRKLFFFYYRLGLCQPRNKNIKCCLSVPLITIIVTTECYKLTKLLVHPLQHNMVLSVMQGR